MDGQKTPVEPMVAELFILFALPPFVLALTHASRLALVLTLWTAASGCVLWLRRQPGFSWRGLWQGQGWSREGKRRAAFRFLALIAPLAGLTWLFAPDRFLAFPMERPGLWLAVMVLYPVLSVIPQALIYRVFFFTRYETLFSGRGVALLVNALCFGLAHTMYGNAIAPVLSACGGALFADSYLQHRSLKWATIEHAAYGCLIFTLGIGVYFFKHGG